MTAPSEPTPVGEANQHLPDALKAQLAAQSAMGPLGAGRSQPGLTQARPSRDAAEVGRVGGPTTPGPWRDPGALATGAVALGAGAVAFSRGAALETARNTLGVAGAGKYSYQAVRAAQGLATTTKATVALDLMGGSLGMGTAVTSEAAATGAEAAKGLATQAKGVAGAGKLSGMAKVADIAGKAAPVVAKSAAVVGVGVGAYSIYDGIQDVREGNDEEGHEKIVGGTADVVTSAALGVAAVSSGTVVGLPVAAVALGVAGVSQAAKYAYKFSDEIADGASWVASKIGDWWD